MSEPRVVVLSGQEVPLQEYNLSLEGKSWRILHAGAVVSEDDEQRFLGAAVRVPYGLALWPSSIALAHEIATRPMKGMRILELGAGTGLSGVVAASLGAHVVQTDKDDVALSLSTTNAKRNGVTTMEHRLADWTAWTDTDSYDFIFGADVLYGTAVHSHLEAIFERNLAPGGRVLISDPFRKMSMALFESMTDKGWHTTMNKWTVGVDGPPRAIGVYELTR